MTGQDHQPADALELKRRAEAVARERAAGAPEAPAALSPEETRQMLHELQVHQIELEMQNEELRAAQVELEGARARYFDLYDMAPMGYCTVSEKGLILEANLTAANLLGAARSRLVKQPISRFILKEDQDIYYRHWNQLVVTGETQDGDLRLVKPDGTVFWANLTGTAAQAEDGEPVCRVVISDITGRKRAEEETRRFRTVSDNAVYGMAIADLQGHLLYVNRFLADLHGYEPEELIGKHLSLFHSREQWEAADHLIASMMLEGHFAPTTVWHRHQDGSEFPMLMSGVLLKDDYGNPQCIAASAIDMSAQHQAAAKIAESEKLLSKAQEIAHIGSWKLDFTANRLTWSDEVYRIFGYEPQEFAATYEAFLAAVHPDDRAALDEAYSRSLREGSEGYETEHRIVRRGSGEVRYVHERCVHERDDAGTIILSTGMVQDISERNKAEEHLRKYQQIVSSTAEGIALLDRSYRYVIVNKAYETFSGKKQEELIGITVAEYLGEAVFSERIQPQFDRCLRGETISYQDWFEYPTLGKRFVEVTYFPYIDAMGDISGVVANSRDITDRKRAEDALRESEETHRALVDGLPDIVMRFDRDGRHLFVSDSVREVIGIEAAQFIGKSHAELGLPEAQCRFRDESIRRVFDSGTPFETEFTVEGKTDAVTFNWRLVPERDARGAVSSVLSISRDITSRKQAEAETEYLQTRLVQAQKMESVGRLAGGVAHDFNNMLGVILGHTQLALDEVEPSQPLYENLLEIRKAGQRSADLTRQLLAFARKQVISPRVLDLNATVASMIKMLWRLIGENIRLVWHPGDGLWPVKMDPSQVDQILANLCVNARDAISGVGKVTIETENRVFDEAYCDVHADFIPGEYVLLAVSDNGCGMAPDTLANLFEPFFTTKEVGQGTGLGLPTVYGAVKQNQGFIQVYSEPARGTTFKIYLPRHGAAAEPLSEQASAEPAARSGETILLVEDDAAVLRMTTKLLEGMGYAVLAAGGPREAMRLAEVHAGAIHLLVTDVVMPEMNGRDLAEHILSLRPNLKRLFMSGYTADVIADQGVLAAGVQFIQKPFLRADLAAKLRQMLGEHSEHQESRVYSRAARE